MVSVAASGLSDYYPKRIDLRLSQGGKGDEITARLPLQERPSPGQLRRMLAGLPGLPRSTRALSQAIRWRQLTPVPNRQKAPSFTQT